MKNNFIFKLFLVTIISSIIAVVSFLSFDLAVVKRAIDENGYNHASLESANTLLEEKHLEDFIDKIEVDFINAELVVKEADEFKYIVYGNSYAEVNDLRSHIEENTLKIEEKDSYQKNGSRKNYRVEIFLPKDKSLAIDYDGINGIIESNTSLKEADISLSNGEVILSGLISYPVNIEMVNGVVDMSFGSYKGYANIEIINGDVEILGEKIANAIIPKNIRRNLGGQKDFKEVEIELVNGTVSIK